MADREKAFENRKLQYKATADPDDVRRKREEDEVQIRKAEKQAILAQKRNKNFATAGITTSPDHGSASSSGNLLGGGGNGIFGNDGGGSGGSSGSQMGASKFPAGEALDKQLPRLAAAIFNDSDRETQLEAVIVVRKLLSKEEAPPIEEVVSANLTPKLVDLMKNSTDPKLTLETAWAVTNIASGDSKFTHFVVQAGGIDAFLSILQSKQALRQELCEQAVWGLGNIAGDGAQLRDELVAKGIIPILQSICSGIIELPWSEQEKENNLKNVLWVMTNCCRGKPAPEFGKIQAALTVFAEVVGRKMKDTLASEALWGIFYAIQGNARAEETQQRLDAFLMAGQSDVSQGVLVEGNQLIRCLVGIIEPRMEAELAPGGNAYTGRYVLGECKDGSYTKDIRIPALKALGELVSAEARVYTDVCLLSGIVPAVMKMLRHVDHAQARKEGCWLVSNLLAALPDQVLAAIMPFDLSVKSSLNPVEKPTDDDKPLPEPEEEILTIFDVLAELGTNLQGNETWSKMKYDTVKEVIYCYTNYFATNEVHNLADQVALHLNGAKQAEASQSSLHLIAGVNPNNPNEVGPSPLLPVFEFVVSANFEQKAASAHLNPIQLLQQNGGFLQPLRPGQKYEVARYAKVPTDFFHQSTFFLHLFASKQLEPTLLSNLVDASTKLLLGGSASGDSVVDRGDSVLIQAAEYYSQVATSCGFAERCDEVIGRLHHTSGKNLEPLLHKFSEFKARFFPEDDLSEAEIGLGAGSAFGNGGQATFAEGMEKIQNFDFT